MKFQHKNYHNNHQTILFLIHTLSSPHRCPPSFFTVIICIESPQQTFLSHFHGKIIFNNHDYSQFQSHFSIFSFLFHNLFILLKSFYSLSVIRYSKELCNAKYPPSSLSSRPPRTTRIFISLDSSSCLILIFPVYPLINFPSPFHPSFERQGH